MRSRQLRRCDSRLSAAPPFLAFPPHPQLWPTSTSTSASLSRTTQNSLGVLSPPLTPEHLLRSTDTRGQHVESGPYDLCFQPTFQGAQRGVMPPPLPHTPPPLSRPFLFTFPSPESTPTFTFEMLPPPMMALSFPPRPSPPKPRKRRRAAADVDGEHSCLHKKKRRLRLFLITSRLSPQFSHPATNIVDRGSSKIAVWAKQKALGRNLLRKAAILNRIRRQSIHALETAGGLGRMLVEQEREQGQLHMAKLTLMYGGPDTCTRPMKPNHGYLARKVEVGAVDHMDTPAPASGPPSPPFRPADEDKTSEYCSPNDAYVYSTHQPKSPRHSYLPLPPSPLGLSNYDAFDQDDADLYSHLDDEYETDDQDDSAMHEAAFAGLLQPPMLRRGSSEALAPHSIFSESSMLEPGEPVVGDYDRTEEGADALWPDEDFALDDPPLDEKSEPSLSPDFPALFAHVSAALAPLTEDVTSPQPKAPLSQTSSSPNFPTLAIPAGKLCAGRTHCEIEDEKQRQRSLMFTRFGS